MWHIPATTSKMCLLVLPQNNKPFIVYYSMVLPKYKIQFSGFFSTFDDATNVVKPVVQ